MVRLNYANIASLAASGAYGGARELDALTCAFLFSILAMWPQFAFAWEDGDTAWDDIEAMLGQAANDLITEAESPSDMLIGTVVPYAGGSLPDLYILCNGQIYQRVDYPELYDVLHSTFHVNPTEFRTPDLRGRGIIGEGSGPGLSLRTIGELGGVEDVTLTAEEMPEHQHQYDRMTLDPAGTFIHGSGYTKSENTSTATLWSGLGQEHENMQPFFVLKYIIYAGA